MSVSGHTVLNKISNKFQFSHKNCLKTHKNDRSLRILSQTTSFCSTDIHNWHSFSSDTFLYSYYRRSNLDSLIRIRRIIMTGISKLDENVVIVGFNLSCTIAINATPKFISASSVKSVYKSVMTYKWLISFCQYRHHFLFIAMTSLCRFPHLCTCVQSSCVDQREPS
jgi:hypothetical protein